MRQLNKDLAPEVFNLTVEDCLTYATLVRFKQEPRRGILQYITVNEMHRKQGTGSHLFRMALEKAKFLNCHILECIPLSTIEAQGFWNAQVLKHNGTKIGMVCLFPLTPVGKLQIFYFRISYYLRYLGI